MALQPKTVKALSVLILSAVLLLSMTSCFEYTETSSAPVIQNRLTFLPDSDVGMYIGSTLSGGYVLAIDSENPTLKSTDIVFVSMNENVAEIHYVRDENNRFYYEIVGIGEGTTHIYAKRSDGSIVSEKRAVSVKKYVKLEKLTVKYENVKLALKEKVSPTVTLKPENASETDLKWTSSDVKVVTVDDEGNVTAVGTGKATVTATAKDGVKSETDFKVDADKRLMKVDVNFILDDGEDNIGHDWDFEYSVNGKYGEEPLAIKKGEKVKLKSKITEEDNYPDVGRGEKSYKVTEKDLTDGFSVDFKVTVKENRGKNAGKKNVFIVVFTFTPV